MSEKITVAVVGAKGRMGATVCQAVTDAADMELVAAVDVGDDLGQLAAAGAQVAVDFTVPHVTEDNVHTLIDLGISPVVGTTGWTDATYASVREHVDRVNAGRPEAKIGVLIAPNFAIGAVLSMQCAQKAAPYFESVEIIELHHPNKVDAPSGTAAATARLVADARKAAGAAPIPDNTQTDPLGARGAVIDGIHTHAVRLRGLNAHQEILFGNPGEQFTIRHDSFDRISFMPGVLLAVRGVLNRPGLTIGIDDLL